MEKLSNEIINKELQKEYDYYCNKYSENNIFGTYLIGIGNYGFAEKIEELEFVTLYLPNFEELCFSSFEKIKETTKKGRLIDMRAMYYITLDPNTIALELLYSDYTIINKKYLSSYNVLLNKKEKIAHVCEKSRLTKAYKRAKEAIKENNTFEFIRLYQSSMLYSMGEDCDNCFHLKNPLTISMLWSAKNKTDGLSQQDIEVALEQMQSFIDKAKDEKSIDAESTLKHAIITFISDSLKENVSVDAFMDCLTATEKKAYQFVMNELDEDGEGYLSIVNMTKYSKISRPIYKNLLDKMEKQGIVEIQNKGVKGTYVKIINTNFLKG